MFDRYFKDRTLQLMGKSIPLQVHHQKRLLEGFPMIFGFLFDVATLSRIDQLWSLIQQIVFIVCIFFFLYLDNFPPERRTRFKIVWKYYDYILQFFFGGLLSAYSIFYFKSASSFWVVLFAIVLFMLMVVNESRRFHAMKFPIRYILASLCLCSFVVYLIPIIFHWMNWFSFLISILLSLFIYLWFIDKIHKDIPWNIQPKKQRVVWGSMVPLTFAILYFFKVIPPVPLSCEQMGIYHDIKRNGDVFELYYTRPAWKFWQHGDQIFEYASGDKVWVFTSVFAPSELQHKIQIRWEKLRPTGGWETTDVIPMTIRGGRDEGYRGVAYKQSVSEGLWRARVETEEGRELRRLRFTIVPSSEDPQSRTYKVKRS